MISNLVIILLLAVNDAFTEERATTYKVLPLASTSFMGIKASSTIKPTKERDISSNITFDYNVSASNQEPRRRDRTEYFHITELPGLKPHIDYSVKDIHYDSVVKYDMPKNPVLSPVSLGKNVVEKKAPLIVKENISRSNHISNENVHNVKGATEGNKLTDKGVSYRTLQLEFDSGVNVNNRSSSGYNSYDADNVLSSSEKVVNQLFYPPNEVQHPAEHSNKYSHTSRSSSDQQINVQIIPDNYEGNDQRDVSPTKYLDDYQEEIEKGLRFDGLKIQSEAASRKFLKDFKGKISGPVPLQPDNTFLAQPKTIQPESLLHTYIYSSQSTNNSLSNSCTTDNEPCTGSSSTIKEPFQFGGPLHTSIYSYKIISDLDPDSFSPQNISKATSLSNQFEIFNDKEKANQVSEVQDMSSDISSSVPAFFNKLNGNKHYNTFYTKISNNVPSQVDIQKSINIHNKIITERNGDLVEQHKIYIKPDTFYDDSQPFQITSPISLKNHPIRVKQAEESYQSERVIDPESISHLKQHPSSQQQNQGQNQHRSQEKFLNAFKPVPYTVHVERLVPQPFPVERVVERFVDRPVHIDRVVEKQVNVPYPVKEVIEKLVDRPVPVEKIIEKLVHIPYPVQIDHFIDRPYAVQVPIPVAVPVPLNQYIDRPYTVEKIVEKPIHVPYPVEKIVEKIVEKHIPVEVERIVEKPIENVVGEDFDNPYLAKKMLTRSFPLHTPAFVGAPVATPLPHQSYGKMNPSTDKIRDDFESFLELVPPPLITTISGHGYKTLPENIDFLILNDYNGKMLEKRGAIGRHVKRSPEFGRNLKVEYGFKPPLVPSLEISDQGLLHGNVKYSN